MENKLRVVNSNKSEPARHSVERMNEESKHNPFSNGNYDDTEIDSILDMCDDF